MNMSQMLQLEDVKKAQACLAGVAHKTPLDYSTTFSNLSGSKVFLKLENMQKTGSFKLRGAYNCIQNLTPEERKCGVITASAGNHAQGVALGAHRAGVKSTIVMPEPAPLSKVEATRGYGAEVVLHGAFYDEAYQEAVRIQSETGQVFVHAFDNPYVIAGQGTIGLEILEQNPQIKAIIVPVGGGGLIAGVALAVKSVAPHVKVYGVQSSGAPSMYLSKNAGKCIETDDANTLADGIAVKRPGDLTFALVQKYVDDVIVVKDEDIAATMLLLLERAKMVVEGAGATALTAALHGHLPVNNESIATIISGGNVDVNFISRIIENGLIKTGRRVKLRTSLHNKPGELMKFITHIADLQANIVYIFHEHAGRNLPLGYTGVELDLETRDKAHAETIIVTLRKFGYRVELS